MRSYDLVIKGRSYSVEIIGISGTAASVLVNGTPYEVEIQGGVAPRTVPEKVVSAPTAAAAQSKPTPAAPVSARAPMPEGAGEGELILSPMPGHIISVAVKAGERVDPGCTVVVMEAMKMENDIKSHISGTVKEIRVSAGQDVAVNEVLVVIGV